MFDGPTEIEQVLAIPRDMRLRKRQRSDFHEAKICMRFANGFSVTKQRDRQLETGTQIKLKFLMYTRPRSMVPGNPQIYNVIIIDVT